MVLQIIAGGVAREEVKTTEQSVINTTIVSAYDSIAVSDRSVVGELLDILTFGSVVDDSLVSVDSRANYQYIYEADATKTADKAIAGVGVADIIAGDVAIDGVATTYNTIEFITKILTDTCLLVDIPTKKIIKQHIESVKLTERVRIAGIPALLLKAIDYAYQVRQKIISQIVNLNTLRERASKSVIANLYNPCIRPQIIDTIEPSIRIGFKSKSPIGITKPKSKVTYTGIYSRIYDKYSGTYKDVIPIEDYKATEPTLDLTDLIGEKVIISLSQDIFNKYRQYYGELINVYYLTADMGYLPLDSKYINTTEGLIVTLPTEYMFELRLTDVSVVPSFLFHDAVNNVTVQPKAYDYNSGYIIDSVSIVENILYGYGIGVRLEFQNKTVNATALVFEEAQINYAPTDTTTPSPIKVDNVIVVQYSNALAISSAYGYKYLYPLIFNIDEEDYYFLMYWSDTQVLEEEPYDEISITPITNITSSKIIKVQ